VGGPPRYRQRWRRVLARLWSYGVLLFAAAVVGGVCGLIIWGLALATSGR
jgi:hypothetical protein